VGLERQGIKRAQLGHLPSVAGNCKAFTALHPVDYFAAAIAKIPDRNLGHASSVSPVRHER
jgi:hypothetical protein